MKSISSCVRPARATCGAPRRGALLWNGRAGRGEGGHALARRRPVLAGEALRVPRGHRDGAWPPAAWRVDGRQRRRAPCRTREPATGRTSRTPRATSRPPTRRVGWQGGMRRRSRHEATARPRRRGARDAVADVGIDWCRRRRTAACSPRAAGTSRSEHPGPPSAPRRGRPSAPRPTGGSSRGSRRPASRGPSGRAPRSGPSGPPLARWPRPSSRVQIQSNLPRRSATTRPRRAGAADVAPHGEEIERVELLVERRVPAPQGLAHAVDRSAARAGVGAALEGSGGRPALAAHQAVQLRPERDLGLHLRRGHSSWKALATARVDHAVVPPGAARPVHDDVRLRRGARARAGAPSSPRSSGRRGNTRRGSTSPRAARWSSPAR